ncbi:hypothetical protein MRX96_012128 [Rhipicephalus microplus]
MGQIFPVALQGVNRHLWLPHTGALECVGLITNAPVSGLLSIPPHWDLRLHISTTIPGIHSKGHTPRAALQREICVLIEEHYADHFMFILTARRTGMARLPLPASSHHSVTKGGVVFSSWRHLRPLSSRC